MHRIQIGKMLLTGVLAATTLASFILDWSQNHLLNPLWHPHARFHGALLLFMLAGVSGTGIWLLWRRSKEPRTALLTAALLSLSFWTPLFYIPSVLPGSTSWAGSPETDPRLHGSIVTPNVIVAGCFVLVTIGSLFLGLSGRRPQNHTAPQSPCLGGPNPDFPIRGDRAGEGAVVRHHPAGSPSNTAGVASHAPQ
jgi:hypothetical protein